MGYDVAVIGQLQLPPKASAAWKKLDATPSTRKDWPDGFGVPVTARATVGQIVKRLATAPGQTWGWKFAATTRDVTIRGVMPDDCWLDHARLIAQLWLQGAKVGATGSLQFRGFETADTAWIVVAGKTARIRAMTKAEKAAADASREMAALHEAAAELVSAAANPFRKAAKARSGAKAKQRDDADETPKARLDRLSTIARDDSAKQKDRAAALAELLTLDTHVAEAVAIEWLAEDDWWEDPKRYSLPRAAVEAAAAIGSTACVDRIVELYLTSVDVSQWVLQPLAATPSPDAAARIATALDDDAFRDSVARATDLLETLAKRKQIGDRARIEHIARDVSKIVGRCDLPKQSKADWVRRITTFTRELLALP